MDLCQANLLPPELDSLRPLVETMSQIREVVDDALDSANWAASMGQIKKLVDFLCNGERTG